MIEFGLGPKAVVPVSTNGTRTLVKGRCLLGPIGVGSVFTRAATLTVQNISDAEPKKVWSNHRKVRLRVEKINAYSRELDEIDEGLTALLELSGEGGDALMPEDILQGEDV